MQLPTPRLLCPAPSHCHALRWIALLPRFFLIHAAKGSDGGAWSGKSCSSQGIQPLLSWLQARDWLQCHFQGCMGGSSPGWGPAPLLLPSTSKLLQPGLTDSSLLPHSCCAGLGHEGHPVPRHSSCSSSGVSGQAMGGWSSQDAAPGYPTGLDPRCCPGVRSPGMSVACGCSGFSEAPGAVLGSEFSITDLS